MGTVVPRFLAALFFVMLFADPASATDPPATLQPYVEDGTLRAGDFGWARGAFDDASAEDRNAYFEIVTWRESCHEDDRAAMQDELATLGASLPDDDIPYGRSLLCLAAYPPRLDAFASYSELESASSRVVPLFTAYLVAAQRAEQVVAGGQTILREQLLARTLFDQVLRHGLVLAFMRTGPFSDLDDGEIALLDTLMRNAIMQSDLENAQWLAAHLAEHGWPMQSDVDQRGAHAAWLIAQHADLDPAFQLRALQSIEPLVSMEEASAASFAILSDRVSLKLSGTQRYGTQLSCRDGMREAAALKSAAQVDALRAEVGLEPLADFVARMNERGGPCR